MEDRTKLAVVMAVLLVAIGALSFFMMHPEKATDHPDLSFVSGTEYNIGEAGQVIVEARFANGSSALAACQLLAWYPDKSLFFNMSGAVSISGAEYVDFVVPNKTGVYEYQAQCSYLGGGSNVVGKSFHVSEFQNDTFTKLNRIKAVMPK